MLIWIRNCTQSGSPATWFEQVHILHKYSLNNTRIDLFWFADNRKGSQHYAYF